MSDQGSQWGGEEFDSAAERSLHEKLELVRVDSPAAQSDLADKVVRTLRWQSLLVVPMTAAAALAGGVLAGVRVIARSGAGS